ncbi:HNH endonuclease domain protein [Candidatus Magnetobacterium bavaricum]|uniref:HNH endonuclease domain protein n=1 Tax=Candidatus Magnetobacterium bavaricum TaxID=29290 RepID=A0A0F3GNW3_9BACT|nr:HNH endonuclease domain protein [Candidatus Magnetobacterium bavaricum]
MEKTNDSLMGYGFKIHKRDKFICQYCGYNGSSLNNWRQLSIEHILPKNSGGKDDDSNCITVCNLTMSYLSKHRDCLNYDYTD